MKTWRLFAVSVAVVLLAGLAIATVIAAEPPRPRPAQSQVVRTPTPGGAPTAPGLVAIAIGQLREADGETATVDLHATIRGGQVGGNLRFFSDDGYYNGGVRTLSVQNGVIRAAGAGGLLKPDGTRVIVAYEAEITVATKRTSIHIRGAGIDYTLHGVIEPGFVFAGSPEGGS